MRTLRVILFAVLALPLFYLFLRAVLIPISEWFASKRQVRRTAAFACREAREPDESSGMAIARR